MVTNLAGGGVTTVGLGQTLALTFIAGSGLTELTYDANSGVFTPVKLHTANNTVVLAADGDPILGGVKIVETRTQEGVNLATVQINGGMRFKYKTGDAVAVGDSIIGAGNGEVKEASGRNNSLVVNKDTVNQTVDVIFGYTSGYGVV